MCLKFEPYVRHLINECRFYGDMTKLCNNSLSKNRNEICPTDGRWPTPKKTPINPKILGDK